MRFFRNNNEQGFASIIALIMVAMLTLLGLAALSTSDDESTIAGNELQEMRAFYAAESGLEAAAAQLHQSVDSTGTIASFMPEGESEMNQCVTQYSTADGGPAELDVLSSGTLAGLNAQVKTYTITSLGTNQIDNSKVELSQSFEVALVPLFQFAVFYGEDLEIAPGPDMNLIGRVHSNGNLWLQAGNTLKMDSYVTASGNMYHGRKGAGGVSDGDVQIKNGVGDYVSMKDGADEWLESTDSVWYDSSIARWQGRVQDSTHGQSPLNLPLTGSSDDPHTIIERSDGGSNPDSYEELASLKIIDGQVLRQVGEAWQDVTADFANDGILTYNEDKFYDGRELEWVDTYELDVQKLYDEGYGPANGVIYFGQDADESGGDWPALRLNNAEELGDAVTIASANPVYTYGDFNSTDKKPAAIMADAVSFLSEDYDDAKSTLSKYERRAKETTVNASIMTGNIETTEANYNGGFENLPRFLEVWSGKNFNWSGSMVCLWNSAQADGTWNGSYYSPPIRNWMYDTDLDQPENLPPETPVFRVFQRTGWKQEYVGFGD